MQVLSKAIRFQKGYLYGLFKMFVDSISEWLNRFTKCFLPFYAKQSLPEGISEGYSFALRLYHARSGIKSCLQKGLALWKVSQLQFILDDNFIGFKCIKSDYDQNDASIIKVQQFYCVMNELNGSSYYRANPYYQQGYLPDGAYKNRRPHYLGEIPQGEEFFQPTNKKHFQRVGYYSTIAQQKIMNSAVRQDNLSPIRDKEYFRSLNVADIEGASTNTLISKGVKNKIKAKQELAKRQYEEQQAQRFQRMKQLQRMEDQKKRMEALNKINKNIQPNYHQVNRRSRAQIKQVKKQQAPQPFNYEEIAKKHAQAEQNLPRKESRQFRMQKDPIPFNNNQLNSYRHQLEQTQRQIKQLEQQLSQVRDNKQRVQKEHDRVRMQSNNIAPVTYQQKYDLNPYLPRNQKSEPNPEQIYNYKSHQQLPQVDPNEQQRLQEHKIANLSLQKQLNQYRKTQQLEHKQQRIDPINEFSGRVTREQHRRFNPTYLSYGSPSIGLAGKNIVKY